MARGQIDTIFLHIYMYSVIDQEPNMKGWQAGFGRWAAIWEPLV